MDSNSGNTLAIVVGTKMTTFACKLNVYLDVKVVHDLKDCQFTTLLCRKLNFITHKLTVYKNSLPSKIYTLWEDNMPMI